MSTRMKHRMRTLRHLGLKVRYADPRIAYDGGGGSLRWSDVSDYRRAEYVPLLIVESAHGVDAYGQSSIWERSNFRRLSEDYPGAVIPLSHTNVDQLCAFVHSIDGDLFDTLVKLEREYPIYDEDDASALEDEEIGAAFDDYLFADLLRELDDEDRERAWDVRDVLRDAFYEELHRRDYYPEHDGHDVRWDDRIALAALRAAIDRSTGQVAA